MHALLNWLWQGSVVAMALYALLHLLDRARANVRYAVCWAALLLVIALPVLSWITSAAPQAAPLAVPAAPAIVSVPYGWWTSMLVMGLAWAAWAVVCATRFSIAMVALRRARARCRPFPASVESSLLCWRRVRDEGRRPTLVLSDAITSAAVLGGGTPMIAVAPSLVATLGADELDRVLIHEWAHVQRRDDLVSVLQVVLQIVVGWHPAAWLIARRLHVEREMACDEMTVTITGSPKSYAACLVKLATLRGRERTVLPVPAALRASGLRARVTRIVSRRASIAPVWSRGIATGVVALLCGVSLAAGGQRLVVAAALVLPFDAVGSPELPLAPLASPPKPLVPLSRSTAPLRDIAATPQHPSADSPVPPASAPSTHEVPSEPSTVVESTPPPTNVDRATEGAAQEPATALTAQPTAVPTASVESERSPWVATAEKAADTGTAIGRTSRDAGVATAGFFSRFARRVAGAF